MKENLSQLLESIYGNPIQVKSFEAIGGGCINETQALKLSNGERVFLKSNPSPPKNVQPLKLVAVAARTNTIILIDRPARK